VTSYGLVFNYGSSNPLTLMTFKQYPSLTVDVPAVVHPGTGYTVSGDLAFLGSPVANAAVTVTRNAGTTTSTVGTFTTDASGAFSFTDQPAALGTAVTYAATVSGYPVTISATGSTETIPAVFPLHAGNPIAARAVHSTSSGSGVKAPVLDSAAGLGAPGGGTSLFGGVAATVQQSGLRGSIAGAASGIGGASAPVVRLSAGSVADASPIQGASAVSVWVWLASMATAAVAAAGIVRRRRLQSSRRQG